MSCVYQKLFSRHGHMPPVLICTFSQQHCNFVWQFLDTVPFGVYFRLGMVHMPGKGKGGRRVPLILTAELLKAMEVLMQNRANCGIPETNVYFFAIPYHDGHVNGWLAMDNVARGASLDDPHLIHSTRLRKYAATVSQVCSLNVHCSFFCFRIQVTRN